jgi:AraC family transcriptional regulator of arabinose operon
MDHDGTLRRVLAVDEVLSEIDVSAGTVVYPPGGTLGPRSQVDLQLVLVHAGAARVWVDGEQRRIRAGQVGLLLPGHRERFVFDGETRHSWVQAHVPSFADRFAALPMVLALSPSLDALVREAVLATGRELLASLALAALWRYAGEASRERPEWPRPVDAAQRFIDAELADGSLTLDRIADAAHVTPAHLVRSFRGAFGVTPMAYLWERRVALAVDLLGSTGLPLGAVAARCGFKTEQHFSRRVRAATGLPPGALRRARWDAGSGT